MLICETCNKNEAIGVCSIPYLPISCAYCVECLNANAHPYHYMVAGTAIAGGYDDLNAGFKQMVNCTLEHLDKKRTDFNKEVLDYIQNLNNPEKGHFPC